MHPVVAARIKKYASGPPKWSVIPSYIKAKMTPSEKKSFQNLKTKEASAEKSFHKYEVQIGKEKVAWKYYGVIFKTIDKLEKFQTMLKKKYSK
jgi:hypothetical protein